MNEGRRRPLFLASSSFRTRRLRDAARMLPVFGAMLMLLPILKADDPDAGTAGVLIYLFGLWALLVLAAALFSGPLTRGADHGGPEAGTAVPPAAPDTAPDAPGDKG